MITGLPGKFSAGFDLKYFQSASPADAAALVQNGGRFAQRLYGLGKPVVAAANGHAIAMGCFILQACDYRICAKGAFRIGANETVIDMVLPPFAQELLHARVRPDRLTEVAIFGTLFGPEEAVEVGLADRVAEPEGVLEGAMEMATELSQLPAKAYAGNKTVMRRGTLTAIEASFAG